MQTEAKIKDQSGNSYNHVLPLVVVFYRKINYKY